MEEALILTIRRGFPVQGDENATKAVETDNWKKI